MGYKYADWLADECRAAGIKVVEVEGWKRRGRPASTGHFDPNGANTTHHTGVLSSPNNPAPGLSVLISGRAGLPGPLCHVATDHNGVLYIIAAGRANHAGRINQKNTPGMPNGGDGNRYALGNEVMTNGTQTLTAAQRETIALFGAVVALHYARNSTYSHRHADISTTGKWDIGQLTTSQLRNMVASAINTLVHPVVLPKRVKRARAELKTEIQRVKKARAVAKKKGENTKHYTTAIKAMKNARKRLKKVPRR